MSGSAGVDGAADFADKVVLMTGGTSGIGAATAREFARRGAHVLIGGRDLARGDSVVAELRAMGARAAFIRGALVDGASARDFAERAIREAGRVDVLVNNAAEAVSGTTPNMTEAEVDLGLAVNVKVPYLLVAALAPAMGARGGGAIINVTSMRAVDSDPTMGLYGASKAALNLLTGAWAKEFGPAGVRVNAVAPGATLTPLTEHLSSARIEHFRAVPAGRLATPEEIAHAIVFLASDGASFIHGVVLAVDGGRTAA